MRLIIATANKGKLKEIKKILKGIKIPIVCLAQLDKKFPIKENGKTFLENAVKKTLPVSKYYSNDLVAGEDSGLEVNYLTGDPGIYSKRFSGKNSNDLKNNKKVLKLLEDVPKKGRRCAFRCVLVLMRNGKVIKSFQGRLPGYVNDKMLGKNGFGYDPIVYLPKYKKTVAQLPLTVKNSISHRAQAFCKLRTYLSVKEIH